MDSQVLLQEFPIPGVSERRTQVAAGGSAAHDAAVGVQHAAAQQARHPAVLAARRPAWSRRYGRLGGHRPKFKKQNIKGKEDVPDPDPGIMPPRPSSIFLNRFLK